MSQTQAQKQKPSAQNPLKDNSGKIASLVRAGLLKSSELPQLKVALLRQQKVGDIARLSKAHRDIIAKYNSGLSSAALGSQQAFQAVRRNLMNSTEIEETETINEAPVMPKAPAIGTQAVDPPMMLVLKRKGVRLFPDGQRVAIYTNERLGMTFSVPYKTANIPGVAPMVTAEEVESVEESVATAQKVMDRANVVAKTNPDPKKRFAASGLAHKAMLRTINPTGVNTGIVRGGGNKTYRMLGKIPPYQLTKKTGVSEEVEIDEAKVSFSDKINAHPFVKSYDGWNVKLKPLYWHKDTKQREMRGTQQEVKNFLKNVEPDTRAKNMQKTAASLKLGTAHQSRISNSPIDLTKMRKEEVEDFMESLEQVAAYASQESPKTLAKHMKFADGSKLKVSHGAAKAIHMVHGALNPENQKKFADMLTTPKGFEKAAHFALSKVEYQIGGK
jgi:hypothetical protein